MPAVVDVLAHAVMKDGAASDMFGDTQSPVIRTEEQLSTHLASKGVSPELPVPQCWKRPSWVKIEASGLA